MPRASPQCPAPVERCNLSLGSGAARARTGRSEQTSLRTRLLDPDLSPSVRCHNSANREEEMRPQTRLLLIDVACTARHIKIVNRREETSLKTSSPPPRPLTVSSALQQCEQERGDEADGLVSSSSPSYAAAHIKTTNTNEETGPKSPSPRPQPLTGVRRCKSMHRSEETSPKTSSPPPRLLPLPCTPRPRSRMRRRAPRAVSSSPISRPQSCAASARAQARRPA